MPTDDDSCNICEGDRSTTKNPIIFCDGKGCDMPVHKRCYRVQVVPKGEWFCQRCECKRKKKPYHIVCCPTQTGAIRKTQLSDEYMHVVCAMWNTAIEHDTDEPYAVPESQLNSRKCYFCSKNQGLCVQCEEPGCKTNFHVTCAINNSLITPAATVPPNHFIRCVQHEIQSKTAYKRPEEEKKTHTLPNLLFPEDQQSSDDDMGPIAPLKRTQTDDSDDDMGPSRKIIKEEALSYRERLDAKRKKSTFDLKPQSIIDRSPIITPLPAAATVATSSKQKLPNKAHLSNSNTSNMIRQNNTTPPIKRNSIIKGIDEIQNEMRVSNPRWSNNGATAALQHPQPTTPNLVNTPFFENEAAKGHRKSINGIDELSKLKEENKRLTDFKRGVSQVFQALNVPIPGADPANDVEQYIIQLQLLMKRVGIISDEERRQIHESVHKFLK